MKLVYLADSTIPSRAASGVQVMRMCQAFAKNGHEVTMIVQNKKNIEPGVDDVYKFYGVEQCFGIKKLPRFPVKGETYIYGMIAALIARKMKPDLVYGRSLHGCYASAALCMPVVFESHVPVKGFLKKNMFSLLIRNKNFKRLIVISDALQRYYADNHPNTEDCIMVAHDGSDLPRYGEETHIKTDSPRLQVGYTGQLYKGRGVELMARMAPKCPWADFHLIGGMEADVAYWRNQCKELSNMTFYGYMPPSQVGKYQQGFDVLLAPYQRSVNVYGSANDTAQWMSPLKIFEYMSTGKAIICSDLPVLREVLTHEKTALISTPDRQEDWIKALERLHRNAELRKRLGVAAREEFQAKYTWKSRASRVIYDL